MFILSNEKRNVTAHPEGIRGVVFGGFAPKNHTPAHPYAGKLRRYNKFRFTYSNYIQKLINCGRFLGGS